MGLRKYELQITTLGDAPSRAAHRVDLVKYLDKLNLDEETKIRARLNPLRLFDDKRAEVIAAMKDAPMLVNYLNQESKSNFEKVKESLSAMDGIAVVVHPSNSMSALTKKQIKAIYTGAISNWSELGGPNEKIVIVSRDTSSGTFEQLS